MPTPTETIAVTTVNGDVTTIRNGGLSPEPEFAMTTPFAMPQDCLNFRGAVMDVFRDDQDPEHHTHVTQHLDEITRSSCWPFRQYAETYSPAVCPRGWTYYSMVAGEYTEDITMIISHSGASAAQTSTDCTNQISAFCCPSGFSMSVTTFSLSTGANHACSRVITSGEMTMRVTDRLDGSVTVFDGSATLIIPTPITVFWHATDASTLTPQPPSIDDFTMVPAWVPGQPLTSVRKWEYDDSPGSARLATGVFVAVIAIPIIMFLAVLGCCICCFRMRRRREKLAIAKEHEELQMLALETSSTQERTLNHSTNARTDATTAQIQRNATAALAAPAAPTVASSSTAARQPSTEIQRAPPEGPSGQNTVAQSLPGFSKPAYPGLPSSEFDGIDEPPPYAEAAPSYPVQNRPPAPSPTSPVQEQIESTTPRESTVPTV